MLNNKIIQNKKMYKNVKKNLTINIYISNTTIFIP